MGGGGGANEAPAFSHQYTDSLVQWATVCFPPSGAAVRLPGMHPHFWDWESPVSDVSLQYRNIEKLKA